MPTPVLIPSLRRLWDNFDDIAPSRDRSSDGWIGDAAHRLRSSSHNPDETGVVPVHDADATDEVHALDVDDDLRQSGLTMQTCIDRILASPVDRARLRYIIYNRHIISASWGWSEWRDYDGDNPHTAHAHFDGSYDSAREADNRDWAIMGDDVSAADVWNFKITSPNLGESLVAQDWLKKVETIDRRVEQVLANLASLAGKDFVNEQEIIDGVLTGLGTRSADEIAVALRAALPEETVAALRAIL